MFNSKYVNVSKEDWEKISLLIQSKSQQIQELQEEIFLLKTIDLESKLLKEKDELLYSYEISNDKLRLENKKLKHDLENLNQDIDKLNKDLDINISASKLYLKTLDIVQKKQVQVYEVKTLLDIYVS